MNLPSTRHVQHRLRLVQVCLDAGLQNFIFEVVTDIPVGLPRSLHVREVVVPPSYVTSQGSLYKARALQYCLEEGVNILAQDDWIVHLDEETLVSPSAVIGIINFVANGRHQFGQVSSDSKISPRSFFCAV